MAHNLNKKTPRKRFRFLGVFVCYGLAATAIVVATATAVVSSLSTTATAAAAEDEDEDYNPRAAVSTKVITHN